VFIPQCEWPSCTLIQNNRQNISSVYFNFHICKANWKAKDSAPNDCKHSEFNLPFISLCTEFDLLGLFPNMWTVSPFQRIYYLSLRSDLFSILFIRQEQC
jgi:hypothetical protein